MFRDPRDEGGDLASMPARAKRLAPFSSARLAPSPDGPLTHFASPHGEKCRLEARASGCNEFLVFVNARQEVPLFAESRTFSFLSMGSFGVRHSGTRADTGSPPTPPPRACRAIAAPCRAKTPSEAATGRRGDTSLHVSPPDGRSTRYDRPDFVALACRAQRTVQVRLRAPSGSRLFPPPGLRLVLTALSPTSPRRVMRNAG